MPLVTLQSVLDGHPAPANSSPFDPGAVFHGWPSQVEMYLYVRCALGERFQNL